jgi:hypothetical protein
LLSYILLLGLISCFSLGSDGAAKPTYVASAVEKPVMKTTTLRLTLKPKGKPGRPKGSTAANRKDNPSKCQQKYKFHNIVFLLLFLFQSFIFICVICFRKGDGKRRPIVDSNPYHYGEDFATSSSSNDEDEYGDLEPEDEVVMESEDDSEFEADEEEDEELGDLDEQEVADRCVLLLS